MAANYWESTQRRYWLFSREQLAEARQKLVKGHSQLLLPDSRLFSIYISQQLSRLGKRMSTRQQALATAQVYVKRFYMKVDVRETNPFLVLTTAFYLACKMEECPHHIRFVVSEARGLWPDFITADIAKLGECEFALIAEMNSQLIVHHPYRTLSHMQTDLALTSDEVALAWSVINDHYLTDLPLLYPPHVMAVMAIVIAVVFKPSQTSFHGSVAPSLAWTLKDGGMSMLAELGDRSGGGPPPRIQRMIDWLAESDVDIRGVADCIQELISLYEVWEQYSERSCKELLTRMMKGYPSG